MIENSNGDEQVFTRSSKRPSRTSVLKPKVLVENKIKEEEEPNVKEEEIETEDPPELYQKGDIVWHRVPGNPWWPALIYGCHYDGYIHTKVVKTAHRGKRRVYFLYFFGPSFEYAWTNNNPTLLYEGLDEFIKHAETAVAKAASKTEQEALANRYELRVSGNKRLQWDQALEEADAALKLTREQRISNFETILENILSESEAKERKRRNSSVSKRQSRKISSSSSTEKSSDRPSVKRQKTKSTSLSSSTNLLDFGFPTLTSHDEKQIIDVLMQKENLTLLDAQSLACQSAFDIVKETSQVQMKCVQTEWFYDLLIKYPEIVFKHSSWFDESGDSTFNDSISLKQYQLKNMLKSQSN